MFDAVCETYHTFRSLNTHLTLFDYFLNLPPELRRTVWTLSLPDPRIVPITYESSTKITRSGPDYTIPPQLHVSREARAIALEHYELAFGTGKNPATIYFDFSKDELYFGAGNISREDGLRFFLELDRGSAELSAQCRKIQKIAIDGVLDLHCVLFNDRENQYLDGRADRLLDIPSFQGLRLITLVLHEGDSDAFLTGVDSNLGEFQSWSICPEGRAMQFTPTPWLQDFYWQRAFSGIWWELETVSSQPFTKFELASTGGISEEHVASEMTQATDAGTPVHLSYEVDTTNLSEPMKTLNESLMEGTEKKTQPPMIPIPTFRMASLSRLAHNNAVWQPRQNFLEEKSFVFQISCMVSEPNASGAQFFLDLGYKYPRLYRALEDALDRRLGSQRQGSLWDIIQVLFSRIVKIPGVCLCPTKHAHDNEILSLEEALAPEGSQFKSIVDWILEYIRFFATGFESEHFREAAYSYLREIPAIQQEVELSGASLTVTGVDAVIWHLIGHIDWMPPLS